MDGPPNSSPSPAPVAAQQAVPVASPAPAPAPVPAAAVGVPVPSAAPPVSAMSGPADDQQQQQQPTFLGWRVINNPVSVTGSLVSASAAAPASPAPAAALPVTAAASLQQKINSVLQQSFGALPSWLVLPLFLAALPGSGCDDRNQRLARADPVLPTRAGGGVLMPQVAPASLHSPCPACRGGVL